MTDTLSTLDAQFLHLEDGISHMHIAGGCVFAGPAPTMDELSRLIRSKLHLVPRYRQRVRSVPLGLGRPVWADDPHFDLDHHLRCVALPRPGDDAAFRALMGRLMSRELDRDRPLWETWLVEGVEGGRWALIFKVHHCLVDGVAGSGLLEVLLDLEPTTDTPPPEPWEPAPETPGAVKVLSAWAGLARDAATSSRGLPDAIRHPATALQAAIPTAQGLAQWVGHLGSTSPLSIDGTIGPRRSWAHADVALHDVKAVGRAVGATVNDVILAAVSGGYRDLLTRRGDDVDTAVLRSLVPVSTRREDGHGVLDNRVSAMLYELPVRTADPVERLRQVQRELGALKASRMAEAGATLTSLGDLALPAAIATVSRLASRAMRVLPQRSINTVITNVPGPQFPLYCLGREMVGYRPFVPIFHGVRVGTAIISYNGRVFIGVTGDEATTSEVDVIADGAVRAVHELRDRISEAPAPVRHRSARPRTPTRGRAVAGAPPAGRHPPRAAGRQPEHGRGAPSAAGTRVTPASR
ncbi:MAG: wax ester/triacylglycerol synthase family O-acyltransferase [Acidimicrobiia bacterium]